MPPTTRAAIVITTVTALTSAAHAGTISIYSHGAALASFDEAGTLRPGFYASSDSPDFYANEPTRGINEFSLAALPSNAVITSATYSYYPDSVTVGGRDRLGFYGYSGNGIAEVTDYGAGSLIHQNAAGVNFAVYNTFDVTAFIQSLVDANATHAGIAIRNNTTELSIVNFYNYYNSLFPDYAHRAPRLQIEYLVGPPPTLIPLPSAAAAGTLALAVVTTRRRRALS